MPRNSKAQLLIATLLALTPSCGPSEEPATPAAAEPEPVLDQRVLNFFDRDLSDRAAPIEDMRLRDFETLTRSIEDCDDICAFYEECGLESPWRTCGESCEEEFSREPDRFQGFIACLQDPRIDCASISSCLLPPSQLPTCDLACEEIEGCRLSFRAPRRLAEGCIALCEDRNLGLTLSSCVDRRGEALCEAEEPFSRCVLEQTSGDCLPRCERDVDCGLEVDVIDCTLRCLEDTQDSDPLITRYNERENRCSANAEDCEALARCRESGQGPVSILDAERLCSLDAGCGFFDPAQCASGLAQLLRRLDGGAALCLETAIGSCDHAAAARCFQAEAAFTLDGCGDYCLAASLCGRLPEGQSEGACILECRDARLGDGSPYPVGTLCAGARSCGALSRCLEEGLLPEPEGCPAFCADQQACGLEPEAECLTRCAAQREGLRSRAERLCSLASSCDGGVHCALPPPPPCALLCDPLQTCELALPGCLGECDDRALQDEAELVDEIACAQGSVRCGPLERCGAEPGAACRRWCAHRVSCRGEELDPFDCAIACARGETLGDEGLALEVNFDQWRMSAETINCAEGDALWIPPDSLETECQRRCAKAEDCSFGVNDEACVQACIQESESEEGRASLRCALRVERRTEGCEGLASCLGRPPPPETPDCRLICDTELLCDPREDRYRCLERCVQSPLGDAARAGCIDRLSDCIAYTRCFEAPDETPEHCVRACNSLSAGCPERFGDNRRLANIEACESECAASTWASSTPNRHSFELAECYEAVTLIGCSVDAIDGCLAGGLYRDLCDQGWSLIEACEFPEELPLFFPDETLYRRECILRAAADEADIEGEIACLEEVVSGLNEDPAICFTSGFECVF